jgi:hydrogenase maturation protease
MSSDACRILVLAWGNPGRRDDGLGPALARLVADRAPPGVQVESDYQLQIEHAYAVASHDVVVFVDAAIRGPEPFHLAPLEPARDVAFTTHALSPAAVLSLARDCFGATPRAFLFAVRGHDFSGFGEGLGAPAARNLAAAADFLDAWLRERRFDEILPGAGSLAPTALPPAEREPDHARR